ncbi:MAG: glycosyl hydrolase [Clostridium lundense]|nr:glycosyl hydrolase [Clostridium lundense]
MIKKLIFTGVTILIVLIISVMHISANTKKDDFNNNAGLDKGVKAFKENINNLSAWVAYWDLDSDTEIKTLDKKLKNVCYFAVNFNSNNKLVMPEQLINYYDETKNHNYNKYITIVNDKINSDGSSSLKDANLLKDLLSNKALISSHIEEIINLAVKYEFDGIEIDYEQIKNDMKLWDDYTLFINELYQRCNKRNLKLRVLLEPNIPFDKLDFKEGPTYVIMCYNLHGGFSEPGEKANTEFIKDLIEKTSKIQGKMDFAIATGGFNWASNGRVIPVSEIEANRILKEYGAREIRDVESQCLVFNYKDEDNIDHEVWYSDIVTLNSWIKIIAEKGYDVSVWRLGGNLFE